MRISNSFVVNGTKGPLSQLLEITKQACEQLTPLINELYESVANNPETAAKLKADKSVFTIADGLVQELLQNFLFQGDIFGEVVGEEDQSSINILVRPYKVDELIIPELFFNKIDEVRDRIQLLSTEIDTTAYKDYTIFIDPIDGTKEFSSGRGSECTILVGVAREGAPVAGLIYRPISQPSTWVAGCKQEGLTSGELDIQDPAKRNGILATNGTISPFLAQLAKELNYDFVRAGGAGNKLMSVIEGKGSCYISDRGVSRWDTCAPQAVVEAFGGTLSKLSTFVNDNKLESYTYRKTDVNLDVTPGVSLLTPYNALDKSLFDEDKTERVLMEPELITPYSNVCGLLAIGPIGMENLEQIKSACQDAAKIAPPRFT